MIIYLCEDKVSVGRLIVSIKQHNNINSIFGGDISIKNKLSAQRNSAMNVIQFNSQLSFLNSVLTGLCQ